MNIIKLALACAVLTAPASALASNSAKGQVIEIDVVANNQVYFFQNGARPDIPSCQSDGPQRWKFDGSSVHGQLMLSTILTALSGNRPVSIVGTGSCDADNETVLAVSLVS